MNEGHTLEPIRFGEFLREKRLLDDAQLLEALAFHWSNGGRLGAAISHIGLLPREVVQRELAVYHGLDSGLDVVEIDG